jgi:cell wall-associated NlpC family hydrolase
VSAPGRTPEDVLNRIASRRATIAAGATLLLVTAATANPSLPDVLPATAAATPHTGGPAYRAPFTFVVPTDAQRVEHAASRGRAERPHRTVRVRAAARPAARHKPARAATRTVHHRMARRAAARTVAAARGPLRAVLAFGRAQIGDPYVFGAARPGAWDCSGLTQKAYARIGISLPHRAAGQARRGVAVSRAAARPGDLVVWGSYHVGIYAGAGRVLHAPRTGKRVQIARIWGSPTFRRITRGR